MKRTAILLFAVLFAALSGCSASPAPAQATAVQTVPAATSAAPPSPSPQAAATQPPSPWAIKAKLPTARFELRAAALGGKLYVIGGSDGKTKFGAVEVYDPAKNSWSKAADIPVAENCLGAAAAGGKLYAFTKERWYGVKAAVYEYDPAADKWEKVSEFSTERGNFGVAVLDGSIYVVGGLVNTDENGAFENVKTVEAFDPATRGWTKKADLPKAKHAVAVSAAGGKLYAMGGSVTLGSSDYPDRSVQEYDPAKDAWTEKAAMPMDSAYHCSAVIGGTIYVTGGLMGRRLLAYDPSADKWTQKTVREVNCWQNAMAELNGKLYVAGGTANTETWVAMDSLEEYDPGLEKK